jgi:RimJ/RimL family protein N-acetyltransferase
MSGAVFALETKSKKFIGTIGLHEINWISRLAEMGILIGAQDEWGKGYASEAEKMILHYGFFFLNLRKIVVTIYKENKGSLIAAESWL